MEHTIGMRIPLILAFLILTLVPLLVQVRFTSGYFYQSHVEERMAEAQNRSLILANKIRSSDLSMYCCREIQIRRWMRNLVQRRI